MRMNPGRLGLPTTCRVAAGTTVRSAQWRGIYGGVFHPKQMGYHTDGMREVFFCIFFLAVFFYIYIYSCYIYIYVCVCFIFDVSILLFVQVMIYVFSAVNRASCVPTLASQQPTTNRIRLQRSWQPGLQRWVFYGSQVAVLSWSMTWSLKNRTSDPHISLKAKNGRSFHVFKPFWGLLWTLVSLNLVYVEFYVEKIHVVIVPLHTCQWMSCCPQVGEAVTSLGSTLVGNPKESKDGKGTGTFSSLVNFVQILLKELSFCNFLTLDVFVGFFIFRLVTKTHMNFAFWSKQFQMTGLLERYFYLNCWVDQWRSMPSKMTTWPRPPGISFKKHLRLWN